MPTNIKHSNITHT